MAFVVVVLRRLLSVVGVHTIPFNDCELDVRIGRSANDTRKSSSPRRSGTDDDPLIFLRNIPLTTGAEYLVYSYSAFFFVDQGSFILQT